MTERTVNSRAARDVDVLHGVVKAPFDVVVFLEHVFACDSAEAVAEVDSAYMSFQKGLAVGDRFANKVAEVRVG